MEVKQIVLTEKCNLNCSYCYIEQKDNMMSEEVFLKHFETFSQDYIIDLFGGEPLLNWDLIKFITGKCLTSSKSRCMGINLYSNGLLLDQEKTDFIKEFDINFFWSYDGLWCDYAPDIQFVKQLTHDVSVQMGPQNLNILGNYEHYIKLGFIPTFGLIKDDVWKPEDVLEFRKHFGWLCDKCYYYIKQGKEYVPQIIKKTLAQLYGGVAHQKSFQNCGAGERMVALMPDGRSFPCARFGTSDYLSNEDDLFKECNSCYLNNYCDKGCYHQAVLNKGPLSSVCELYKIVFDHVVKLNRLLKGDIIWQQLVK